MHARRFVPLFTLAMVLAGANSAPAGQHVVPCALWKLGRGVVNVAVGLPGEIVRHAAEGHTQVEGDSAGDWLVGGLAGAVYGAGWGAMRIGSGFVDIFTFPVPFDENRPLLEPEFAF